MHRHAGQYWSVFDSGYSEHKHKPNSHVSTDAVHMSTQVSTDVCRDVFMQARKMKCIHVCREARRLVCRHAHKHAYVCVLTRGEYIEMAIDRRAA